MSVLEMSSRHGMIRRGQKSAVAAVCYITASQGTDERTGQSFNYGAKGHVTDIQVMLPEGMPSWMNDSVKLMAAAELYEDVWAERRFKTPLYQEKHKASAMVGHTAHYSLSNALRDHPEEMWSVIRAFVEARYTAYGVGVVVAVHDEAHNLHFHVQATKRVVESSLEGFGRKAACFQSPAVLSVWAKDNRATLAHLQNEALGRLGVDQVVEHRSFVDREIDLEATLHHGELGDALLERGVMPRVCVENQEIESRNREVILDNPGLILGYLSASRATFTEKNIFYEITRRMDGDQALVHQVWEHLQHHEELVTLPCVGDEEQRYTTKTYQAHESRLFEVATQMHGEEVPLNPWADVKIDGLNEGQEEGAWALASRSRLVLLRGAAGVGKTTLLRPVARYFEEQGYRIRGLALAGVAVEGLRDSLGCEARTIASFLKREVMREAGKLQRSSLDLSSRDVVILDEAGMVDVPTLSRVLSLIEKSGAMVRLVGDPEQLKPIGAGDAFRGLWERLGGASLQQVVRQKEVVDREAVSMMSRGYIDQGLGLLRDRMVWHETDADVLSAMVISYMEDRIQNGSGGLMLAFLRRDVKVLNDTVRTQMRAQGMIQGERSFLSRVPGERRSLGIGDAVIFLKKEESLGVVNGTRGQVVGFDDTGQIRVKTEQGRDVTWHPDTFTSWDYAYALTVHKSQGVTVRQAWMKADRMLGSEGHYVGLSRHQERVTLMVSKETFKDETDLIKALERGGQKDLILDRGASLPQERHGEESLARYKALAQERWDRTLSEAHQAQVAFELRELSGDLVRNWDKTSSPLSSPLASLARLQGITLRTLERQAGFRVRPSSSAERIPEARVGQYQELASQAGALWKSIRKTHPGVQCQAHPDYGVFQEIRLHRDALASDMIAHKEEHSIFVALEHLSWKALASQAKAHQIRYERTADQEREHSGNDRVHPVSDHERIGHGAHKRLTEHVLAVPLQGREQSPETASKIAQAVTLVDQSQPIQGTVAERYLRENRGLQTCDLSDDVRFLPQGSTLPSGHTTRHPALMVVGRDAEDQVRCVQITTLDASTARKADVDVVKRTYGALSGSWVCVQKGQDSEPIVVAEGVETALSLKEAGIQGTIYSTLGIHNLKHVKAFVPEGKTEVILAADQDGQRHERGHEHVEPPSHRIVSSIWRDLEAQGHTVHVIRPEATPEHDKRDWNDVLKAQGAVGLKEALDRSLAEDRVQTARHPAQEREKSLQSPVEQNLGTKVEPRSHTEKPTPQKHMPGQRYDLKRLNDLLKTRVHEILPKVVTCPLDPKESSNTQKVFKDAAQKISLCVEGSKAGLWYDFKRGLGGNIIDLIQDQRHVSKHEAIVYAAKFVGLDPEQGFKHHVPIKNHERPKPDRHTHPLSSSLKEEQSPSHQEKSTDPHKVLPQEKEQNSALSSENPIKASYEAHMPFLKRSFKLQKEVMLFEEKKFARDVIKGLQERKGEVLEQGFVLSALQTSRLQGRLRVESVIQGNPQSEDLLKKDAIKVALQTHSRLEGFQKDLEAQRFRPDLVQEGKHAFLGHLQRYGQDPSSFQKEHIMRVIEAVQPLKEHMEIPKALEYQKNALWTYCVDRVLVSMRDGRSLEVEALKTKIQAISKQLQTNLRVMTRQITQERAQNMTHDLTNHPSRGRDWGR